MSQLILLSFMISLLAPVASHGDIVISIPPQRECTAENLVGGQYRGSSYDRETGASCDMFGQQESQSCAFILNVANAALKKCQAHSRIGKCKIVKCWENPQ